MIISSDEVDLSKAVQRLTGRPHAGDKLIKSLREGIPTAAALRKAGVRKEILQLIEAAPPANLPQALNGLARCFEHDDHRQRSMRLAALYPAILAAVIVALSLTIHRVALPSVAWLGHNAFRVTTSFPSLPFLIAAAVPAFLLVMQCLALYLDKPLYPFNMRRETHDRALLLGVASSLTAAGAPLEATLRAAAPLAGEAAMSHAARALAASLDHGGASADDVLMGSVQTALFKAAAARGAGTVSLSALAEWHEREAVQSLPRLIARTELLTVAIGGVAIAAAAIAFVASYSRLVAGG